MMENGLEDSMDFASDFTSLKSENRTLKAKLRHIQSELSIEQGLKLSYNTPIDLQFLRISNCILYFTDTVTALRKKLNSTERERLDAVSRSTEQVLNCGIILECRVSSDEYFTKSLLQVSRLDSEATKLRSQLERGEALRQNLECELARARRDVTHEKRSVYERDALLSEVNDTMKRIYCTKLSFGFIAARHCIFCFLF